MKKNMMTTQGSSGGPRNAGKIYNIIGKNIIICLLHCPHKQGGVRWGGIRQKWAHCNVDAETVHGFKQSWSGVELASEHCCLK